MGMTVYSVHDSELNYTALFESEDDAYRVAKLVGDKHAVKEVFGSIASYIRWRGRLILPNVGDSRE